MADFSQSATAKADGTATVQITHNKSGLQWVVYQTSVKTIPKRGSAQATVTRNGTYVSSTISGSADSAQGPPSFQLFDQDILQIDWVGMTAGDQCIASVFYNELPIDATPNSFGVV